jgi:hypothetical protein
VRNTVRRWLTVVAVGGGLVGLGSPAIAAPAAPAGVGDSGHICLTSAPSYCIEANGAGNQVTITSNSADYATFTVVFDSSGVFEWQDNNQRCLREGNNNVVKIENGQCSLEDDTDAWYKIGTQISNEGDTDIMYTNGDANGDDVWANADTPGGAWKQWNAPT